MATEQTCNRRRWPILAAVVLLVATGILFALIHGWLWSVSEQSRDESLSLEQRATLAGVASSLEPWSERFRLNAAIAQARRLRSANTQESIDEAYFLLLPYATTVRNDDLFRATYQDVIAAKWVFDARKAHQQHAKEQKDGALAPDAVFK